jgi:hypothetical protein
LGQRRIGLLADLSEHNLGARDEGQDATDADAEEDPDATCVG